MESGRCELDDDEEYRRMLGGHVPEDTFLSLFSLPQTCSSFCFPFLQRLYIERCKAARPLHPCTREESFRRDRVLCEWCKTADV